DLAQAEPGHLEHADLVGRAEAVLHRAQNAELVRAFALEREHRVDHVLDHARAGDLAVLGDVANQNDRRTGALGKPHHRLRPGAESTGWVHRVWFESMMIRRGVLPCPTVATLSSPEVSAASSTGADPRPSRSARSRTCATASSPEM